MIVKPKIRDFICTTAHPKGLFENVKRQIEYIKSKPKNKNLKKGNILIVGCSTGYGHWNNVWKTSKKQKNSNSRMV